MGESVVAVGHYERKVFHSERVPYERISASNPVFGTAAKENGGLILGTRQLVKSIIRLLPDPRQSAERPLPS